MESGAPLDEMVDGRGGLRPHWRNLLGALTELGREALAERAARLARAFAEEGVATLLPGAPPDQRRGDPIPLLLSESEFVAIEAGLAQRARLFEAILADVYGPQRLLAEGELPPALVFANPLFLRPCRAAEPGPSAAPAAHSKLDLYAADLVRGPDGAWRVLADHTGWADGAANALENRRMLARIVPEIFHPQTVRQLRPFLEAWQDGLQRLVPPGGNAGAALLTPGHADPAWYDHVLLARELSCALVEGGDLTVRGDGVFLKTLRGLKPIGVLLRAMDGRLIDPLELEPNGIGVAGLLDAARRGAVRIVNDPGSGLTEAPGLSAFLPGLARRLLGERLELAGAPTLWLGEPGAVETLHAGQGGWAVRPAADSRAQPVPLGGLSPQGRERLLARVAEAPWNFAACAPVPPSLAPCIGPGGFVPCRVVMRLFLLREGEAWRAMQGGLVRALPEEGAFAWRLPERGLEKDLWILAETPGAIVGAGSLAMPPLAIRRTSGDLPSRVADNFFWLGRYLERLEGSARLQRAAIIRIARPAPTPREMAELQILTDCLAGASLVDPEFDSSLGADGLAAALLRAARDNGSTARLLGLVSHTTSLLRDRLTGEMYSAMSRALREHADALRRVRGASDGEDIGQLALALSSVLHFSATVAGLAAENMVRGGGRLFLDLGRRVERAQTIADELACALKQPGPVVQPGHVDLALRLTLELRDSVITYQSRYLAVLQPAPALDLVLADEGNPRGLAFQLAQARDLLAEIAGAPDSSLAIAGDALLTEAQAMVRDVERAADQAAQAVALPTRLLLLKRAVSELSDRLARRYFALLPAARSVGLEAPPPILRSGRDVPPGLRGAA